METRPTFYTWKTPTKFRLDPLTPSKVIVSTWKVLVRTYIQTDRQTDRQTDGNFLGLFCLLRHKNHKHLSKGENFFFTHAITILSLFTYSVCDEKVKIYMDSEKSINSFEIKKRIGHRNWRDNFFWQFFNNCSALLLCKIYFFTSWIWLIFSDFCYIAKYWNSNRVKLLAGSVYVRVKHPWT